MRRLLFTLLAAIAFQSASAHAAFPQLTGEILELTPAPSSVKENVSQFNDAARLFAERQSFTLTAPLAVSISASGVVDHPSKLSPSTIPAGTVVNSYYFHADTSNNDTLLGSIRFDTTILGVILTEDDLQASHASLGLATVTYPASGSAEATNVALELKVDEERLTVGMAGGQIDFFVVRDVFFTNSIYDGFRVITSTTPVPEPSALAVAMAGCVASGLRRR